MRVFLMNGIIKLQLNAKIDKILKSIECTYHSGEETDKFRKKKIKYTLANINTKAQ